MLDQRESARRLGAACQIFSCSFETSGAQTVQAQLLQLVASYFDALRITNHSIDLMRYLSNFCKYPKKLTFLSQRMAEEIIDKLDDIEAKLHGLTGRFEVMQESLKAKIESPENAKYISQAGSKQAKKEPCDFYVIAACCRNNGIGKDNTLPWRLKNELAYFNRMTTEPPEPGHKNIVIMGRKTWSSIPPKYRPLSGRSNVVLSRTVATIEDRDSVDHIFSSLFDALEGLSEKRNKGQVWIVGGQSVYEEALKMKECKRIYLTRIDHDFDCDTFFPNIDEELYKQKSIPDAHHEEDGIKYEYTLWERIE